MMEAAPGPKMCTLRHVGIVVTDLSASLAFYRDRLGFRVQHEANEKGAHLDRMLALTDVRLTTVKLAGPHGQMIELLFFHSRHGQSRPPARAWDRGLTHMAFTVKHIDRLYNDWRTAGITFNAPPQNSPDGKVKVTFCQAPEGTLIELVEVL